MRSMESGQRHPRESTSAFILRECVIAHYRISAMQRRIDEFMSKYPLCRGEKTLCRGEKSKAQDQVRTISASDLLIHKLRCLAKI